jgi:hypothetical protein
MTAAGIILFICGIVILSVLVIFLGKKKKKKENNGGGEDPVDNFLRHLDHF